MRSQGGGLLAVPDQPPRGGVLAPLSPPRRRLAQEVGPLPGTRLDPGSRPAVPESGQEHSKVNARGGWRGVGWKGWRDQLRRGPGRLRGR